MKHSLKTYWKLFTSNFFISAFTFGGGYVIIPLMKKKYVENLHWLEEKEMLDLTAIAQSAPGAIAVNASIMLGYRVAGLSGAVIAVLAAILPPLILISIISVFYDAFRQNAVVAALLKGMQAGVAAVICDVVYSMGLNVAREKRVLPWIIMLGSFVAVFWFKVNIILIIVLCGVIGGLEAFVRNRRQRSKEAAK